MRHLGDDTAEIQLCGTERNWTTSVADGENEAESRIENGVSIAVLGTYSQDFSGFFKMKRIIRTTSRGK